MYRRSFLQSAAVMGSLSLAENSRAAAGHQLPYLGIVVHMEDSGGPDGALQKVHRLGFSSCQLFIGTAPKDTAEAIREAAKKYGIEITAFMTLGAGRLVWDLREGPETVGLVPRATRAERIAALKQAADMAKICGVKAVHTHCGFIPENPNEKLYPEVVAAMKDVATHCREQGCSFLCETGQETPITLLRAINDTGLDNVAVNLDLANLILYGKGDPVGALDVLGPHVRGMHAKDGLYPTDPYGLGKEVAIGSGDVSFDVVFRKLAKLSYTGPITIEREISGSKQEADIRESRDYLEKLMRRAYSA